MTPSPAASSEVISFEEARRRLHPEPGDTSWTCPACDLVAGPFTVGEAACLADVHNRLMHRGSGVARPGAAVGDDALAV